MPLWIVSKSVRLAVLPGMKRCIDCPRERYGASPVSGAINRRGSKDSQLK